MNDLDPRIEFLSEKVRNLEKDMEAVKSLLPKLSEGGKIDLNLTVQELAVNIHHAGNITVDVDTTTGQGQILYCALKDLNRKSFTEAEMSAALDEHGWHMAHGTLSPVLIKLVRKKLLIKEPRERKKAYKYRLPSKVTFRGAEQ